MSRFDEWKPQLLYKRGTPGNMLGIDLWHDFTWTDVVPHGMAQFPYGFKLAEFAIANCRGKKPALVLTVDEDELEGPFETDTHHYIVICLPRYLREAEPNAAAAYIARRTEVYEANMARLEELATRPDLIHEALTAEVVANWMTADPSRSDQVATAMPDAVTVPPVDPAKAIVALGRYWNAVANDPGLRDALFTEEGATSAFALWLADNPVEAAAALQAVSSGSLAAFDAVSGMARLRRFLDEWHSNRKNPKEESWQALLTQESWALGQLFGSPFVIVQDKAYVGGKTISNSGGRIADFIFKNRLTGNTLIVEIKTPVTPLLTAQYRDQVYPPSKHLVGGITQALDQKHLLMENFRNLDLPSAGTVPFNPRAVVLIGDLDRQQIVDDKRRSFELFRNGLTGVEVVTFDELAAKAEGLLELFGHQ